VMVVDTGNPKTEELFCVVFYPSISNVTNNRTSAPRIPLSKLEDLQQTDTCNDADDLSQFNLEGRVAFISVNKTFNCSIAEKVSNLQKYKVLAVLTDGSHSSKNKFNASDYQIDIVVASILDGDKTSKGKIFALKEKYPKATYSLYVPEGEDKSFDISLVIIMAMAVFTVMAGSFWSGYVKQALRLKKEHSGGHGGGDLQDHVENAEVVKPQDGTGSEEEELSVMVSPLLVIFFVFCMCSMLVLLYFFFDQLVYVIMGMFCLASTQAMYICLEPLVMSSYGVKCLPVLRLPRCNLYLCRLQLEFRQFLLLLVSVGTAATWLIFRKEDWSWMLQDFLGILFSINMLKVLRLPSLKICTILLGALFFYDIFFVFITPLFMKNNKSIMVEVATGGSSGEQLPMVLKVPHFSSSESMICYVTTYSLLGFGDILVPGLLLSYCHSYDLLAGTRYKLYWVITSVAYILGLIATFISLFLMNSAQPALLYLVPFTLIPTILVAALRGDLGPMWEGDFKVSARRSVMTDSPQHHRTLEEEDCDDNGRNSPQDDIDNEKGEDGEKVLGDNDQLSSYTDDTTISNSQDSGSKKLINTS